MLDDCRAILLFWRETQMQFRLLLLVVLGVVIVAGVAGRRAWQSDRRARHADVAREQAASTAAAATLRARRAVERVRSKHRQLRAARAEAARLEGRVALLVDACARREQMVAVLQDELVRQDHRVAVAEQQLDERTRELTTAAAQLSAVGDLVEHIDL